MAGAQREGDRDPSLQTRSARGPAADKHDLCVVETNRKCTQHSPMTTTRRESSSSQRGLGIKFPFWKHSSQTLLTVGVKLGEPTGQPEPLAQTRAAAGLHPGREPYTRPPSGGRSPLFPAPVSSTRSARVGSGRPGPSLLHPL